MDAYVDLCASLGIPAWMASLLHAAKRLRNDHARRKKVYRLLHRKLLIGGVGVGAGIRHPTYVYPNQVKTLLRSAFPDDVRDHCDPAHNQVVYVTMEDLHRLGSS